MNTYFINRVGEYYFAKNYNFVNNLHKSEAHVIKYMICILDTAQDYSVFLVSAPLYIKHC